MKFQRHHLIHKDNSSTDWHQHPKGQLFWISRGVLSIEAGSEQWMITSGAVGWIPPDVRHRTEVVSECDGMILMLPAAQLPHASAFPRLVALNPLSDAIIRRLESVGSTKVTEPQQRLLGVLMDEINAADDSVMRLPMPTDKRLRLIADALLNRPDDRREQPQLACHYGLSPRHMSRLFVQQTGMTFARWRQLARVLSSLRWLARHESVTQTALACGFENTSSYITAFKHYFGVTPGKYVHRDTA
ncbi:helix-turn-helix domain-containing protein [Vibrio sp. V37_P2S8PM304]|nr:helix-turn-helix domain-containing protein [Vibrio sp. V37_P2S8PM304]